MCKPTSSSHMPAVLLREHHPPCGPPRARTQAKEALMHPYFDDMDKVAVDALENPDLEEADDDF